MTSLLLKRDIVEQLYPSDAGNVGRTSGVGGAWSTYAVLSASLPADFILLGLYVTEAVILIATGAIHPIFNLQVATGGAGSEVTVGESQTALSANFVFVTGASTYIIASHTHRMAATLIPAGTRLTYRTSSSDAAIAVRSTAYAFGYNASEWALPLSYLDPERYMKGLKTQTQASITYPSPGSTGVLSNVDTAWLYGAPVEFIASAPSPLLIRSAVGAGADASLDAQGEICLGGAGSEVAHSKFGMSSGSIGLLGPTGDCELARPLFVKTGERVSVILATSAKNKTVGIALKGEQLK